MLCHHFFRRMAVLGLLTSVFVARDAAAQWGTITGQFVFDGEAPAAASIAVTKDQEVCGKHPLVDEQLTVNPTNKGISGIVLYMDVARGKKAPEAHPDYAQAAANEIRIDNSNCRFEPHVVTLRTTQTLVVGNKDAVGHNVKVDTVKNVPINPIIPANGEIKQVFKQEERLPTKVSCSIHPWMTAIVVIKDTPYMAVSDADGKFTIANVPVGKMAFQVWHEKAGYVAQVNVGGKDEKWAKGRVEWDVKDGANDLGVIKLAPALFSKK